jgi:hypothetical protein
VQQLALPAPTWPERPFLADSEWVPIELTPESLRESHWPALVGFLAYVSRPHYRGMSKAKSPEDKCVECGHPRQVHHDYGTPHCIPTPEAGQPAVVDHSAMRCRQ